MGCRNTVNLNLDERLSIEKMLKEGAKTGTIASTIGRSHSCIKQEIRKGGGGKLYDAKQQQWRYEEGNRAKIRALHKGLTDDQAKKVAELFALGESVHGMSLELGVTEQRISTHLKFQGMVPKKLGQIGFRARIESLEQQCEILFELIKQLEKK